MATVKDYAYYIKGQKVALIEKDTAFDNDPNSKDYGPGAEYANWKSPTESIADGLEIEYVYSPEYTITRTNSLITSITNWRSNGGFLQLKGGSVNYDTTLDVDGYIVLRNAGQHNGLHRIKEIGNVDATNDGITMYTKVSASSGWATSQQFQEVPQLYYHVNVLNDESSDIDLPSYLSKALVYYVKAKLAEDTMNLEAKQYFMKEFRKMVEKYDSTRYPGVRRIVSGIHAIR